MNTFRLVISSPDGNKFAGDAVKLDVRGTEGDLAVMAGHIPLITAVKGGACHILLDDGTVKNASLDGGLLTVAPEQVTLIAGSFKFSD